MPVKEKLKDKSNLLEISETQTSIQTIIYFLQRLESRIDRLDGRIDKLESILDKSR